jgi:hypothetical protein
MANERISIWTREGKKGRKGGMSGGKGVEDKGAREREETHQKRRLWRHPKAIAEAGGASGSLALAKRIDSSDARTKFCRGKDPDISITLKSDGRPHPDIGEALMWRLSSRGVSVSEKRSRTGGIEAGGMRRHSEDKA